MRTVGYGGKKIRHGVRLKTNDPNRPIIELAVTGMVEKFAEIRPERVNLAGPAGQPLLAEVEIVPRKDHPFTIRELKAKNGNFINFSLIEKCKDGRNRCVLRVENKRSDKGRYVDAIYVMTDSPIRPSIAVYVSGVIQ